MIPLDGAVGGAGHGNRTCVSGMAAMGWPLPEELGMYRRVGADLAGLVAHKIEAFGHDRAVAEIARSGVDVGYLVHPFTVDPQDDRGWMRELRELAAAVQTAVEIGAPLVYLTSGPSGSLSWERAAESFVDRMVPAVRHARESGIALAIENTSPVRCDLSFTHSVRDALALARMLDIGVCVDLYCCWQESGLVESLRAGLQQVELVQVSDLVVGTRSFPNRWVPGDADLPLDRLLGDLLALGYTGTVDLELAGPEIEREGAESALTRGIAWITEQLHR